MVFYSHFSVKNNVLKWGCPALEKMRFQVGRGVSVARLPGGGEVGAGRGEEWRFVVAIWQLRRSVDIFFFFY